MKKYIFLTLLILTSLLMSCGKYQVVNQGYTIVTEPRLKIGDLIPVPTGEVILSIEGKIRIKNVDNRLDFDLQTLEHLGLVTYKVDDPDLKREVTYTGVLLRSVIEIAGLEPGAQELATTALNDYKADIPLDVLKWPVMVATMRDGERMTIEEKGPLEIVFPNRSFDIESITHNPMWVWQLRFMMVQ